MDREKRNAPDCDPTDDYWATVKRDEARAMRRKEFRKRAQRRLQGAARPKPEGYAHSLRPTIPSEDGEMPDGLKGL